jgi:hypothetical protein
VTVTDSLTHPIATSLRRFGSGLQISLSYDSGAGNGPFGFGWSLSVPIIALRTNKGLRRYQGETRCDTFVSPEWKIWGWG